jgi:hypothetical protein
MPECHLSFLIRSPKANINLTIIKDAGDISNVELPGYLT